MDKLKHLILIIVYIALALCITILFPFIRIEWIFVLSIIPIGIITFFYVKDFKLFYSLLSACLTVLSFPDIDYWFLMFFSFIPIFFIIPNTKSYKSALFFGIITGITTLYGGFYWLIHTLEVFGGISKELATPIFILYSVFFSLKFPLIFIGLRWINNNLRISKLITYPIVITIADFLVIELFPWYFGSSQYKNIYFIQIAEITGVIGITYLIAFFNTLIYTVYLSLKEKRVLPRKEIFIGIGLLIFIYGFGIIRIDQVIEAQKTSKPIRVGLVQPNTPMGKTKDVNKVYKVISVNSINLLKDKKLDLLIWPESAASFSYRFGVGDRFIKLIDNLAKTYKTSIFFGDSDYKREKGKRTKVYNSASLILPDLSLSKPYHKVYPLAFGEYLPLGEWFPQLYDYDIVKNVGKFSKGESIEIFDMNKAKLAPQICYEIIIPSFTRQFINKGANVIVNITNDVWFGNTKASKQHLVLALFRAVENRTPIVRSTNSGISTFINPVGEIVTRETPLYTTDTLTHTIRTANIKTFYTKFGDIFAYIISAMGLLLFIFKKYIKH